MSAWQRHTFHQRLRRWRRRARHASRHRVLMTCFLTWQHVVVTTHAINQVMHRAYGQRVLQGWSTVSNLLSTTRQSMEDARVLWQHTLQDTLWRRQQVTQWHDWTRQQKRQRYFNVWRTWRDHVVTQRASRTLTQQQAQAAEIVRELHATYALDLASQHSRIKAEWSLKQSQALATAADTAATTLASQHTYWQKKYQALSSATTTQQIQQKEVLKKTNAQLQVVTVQRHEQERHLKTIIARQEGWEAKAVQYQVENDTLRQLLQVSQARLTHVSALLVRQADDEATDTHSRVVTTLARTDSLLNAEDRDDHHQHQHHHHLNHNDDNHHHALPSQNNQWSTTRLTASSQRQKKRIGRKKTQLSTPLLKRSTAPFLSVASSSASVSVASSPSVLTYKNGYS